MFNTVKVGDVLSSLTTDYLVLKTIGEGVYGEVVECLDIKNQKIVAVKILKYPNSHRNAKHEVHRLLQFEKDEKVKLFGACWTSYCFSLSSPF